MSVVRISCDLCGRVRRCLRIETERGHQIDLCAACLEAAVAALKETA